MKKSLLMLAAMLISIGAMAAKHVPTKVSFPDYEGYFVTSGSADYLFDQLTSDLDNDDPELDKVSFYVDRSTHTVKATIKHTEDNVTLKFKMAFTTRQDRIYYTLSLAILSDGEDITDLVILSGLTKDEIDEFNEVVFDLLNDLAKEF